MTNKSKLTVSEMEKAVEAAIRQVEKVEICEHCGCKNGYHYSHCKRVAHLFKKGN